MIRILGLPTRHPYTAKLAEAGKFEYVNPDTDYFNGYGGNADPESIGRMHPPDTYDLVHIHFSFDKLTADELERLLKYFGSEGKPVVWTCHSRESQRERNLEQGKLQELLHKYSKAIISPTEGCKAWIKGKFGAGKEVSVIPLGFMASPETVSSSENHLKNKDKRNFVYLVGEFRKNKEVLQSVVNFLQCSALGDCTLTLIMKPIGLYSDEFDTLDEKLSELWGIIANHPRIKIISLPEISNELLVETFLKSHACLLPYLWGTHSGQVELCRDCGCYPVISDVGFYEEQWDRIVGFPYDKRPAKFAYNLTKAMIEAYGKPILAPDPESRALEHSGIIKKHEEVYRRALQ